MFVLHLNQLDIRTAALALAESARRRPRGSEGASASRSLARSLSDAYPVAQARGEAFLDVSRDEADTLRRALAGSGAPFRYAERAAPLPWTAPAALLERLGA